MTVTINGSGTIGGISVGGLNDNIITKNEMATGGAWAPAGTVLQVVSATYSTQVANSSTTLTSSGLTASITPTSASSKILVLISDPFRKGAGSVGGVNLQLYRNGASIYSPGASMFYSSPSNTSDVSSVLNISYLDSPASTSSVTYALYFALAFGGSGYSAYAQIDNYAGTITLMEIAA